MLMQNLAVMRNDIRTQYEMSLSASHHGHPSVVGVLRTGRQGRPRLVFDSNFLEWAITQQTTSRVASSSPWAEQHYAKQCWIMA